MQWQEINLELCRLEVSYSDAAMRERNRFRRSYVLPNVFMIERNFLTPSGFRFVSGTVCPLGLLIFFQSIQAIAGTSNYGTNSFFRLISIHYSLTIVWNRGGYRGHSDRTSGSTSEQMRFDCRHMQQLYVFFRTSGRVQSALQVVAEDFPPGQTGQLSS